MHIHFIAIAGTGMGSLAGLLRARGHRVTGSDEGVYPPMSDSLAAWGIPVALGFRPENVLAERPDLVVIGNAVRAENPEARAVMEAGIPHQSFPQALFEHAMRGRRRIAVTGTHGKTTTTSMVATLLHEAGRDPSMLVGGIAQNFDGSFRDGAGPDFVVEGDEYDTAFFDKSPKFLHYRPQIAILTSIEFDHADVYRDLGHMQGEFAKLLRAMPRDGAVVAAAGSEAIEEVLRHAPCRVLRYGVESAAADFCAQNLEAGPEGTRFGIETTAPPAAPQSSGGQTRALLPAYGAYNVNNALAAVAAAQLCGVPLAQAAAALAAWRGVKRRQEVRGAARGITLVDDFAHHPTAVRETLAGLRARFPGRRLVAVFEPRSNTSRRARFEADFARALEAADFVLIQQVADEALYSAFGETPERLDAGRVAAQLETAGTPAAACADVDAIVERLAASCEPGDVVVTLSNGGFGGIWERLLQRLEAPQS
ncbi:MAG: Mur ligase family protein [Deltaproteobacteria bacterium]|nr:Mur ligase family protein [Deltaproteobacteria bacterium]